MLEDKGSLLLIGSEIGTAKYALEIAGNGHVPGFEQGADILILTDPRVQKICFGALESLANRSLIWPRNRVRRTAVLHARAALDSYDRSL